VQAISVQEIAAEAGVSTATLYRWWPTKEAVLLDSYTNRVDDTALLHADGSPLHRLRKHLMNVAQMFKGEEGRVSLRLLMAIQEDQILRGAFFERIYRPKVDRCLAVMREAVEQGELPRGTDLRLFLDSVFGVLLTNLILKHEDVDNALIGKAFDFAVAGAQAKAR
jgi:AcrR family transcriptional regulator